MTGPGALALQAVTLVLAAFVMCLVGIDTIGRNARERIARIAWVLFAAGIASLIGAYWWEVLS